MVAVEPGNLVVGHADDALLPENLKPVVLSSTDFKGVTSPCNIPVQWAKNDAQSEVRRITPSRGPVAHDGDPPPLVEDGLQRRGHCLRQEVDRVLEIALPRPVSAHEDG